MAIVLPTGQWYAPSAVINDAWYCMVLQAIEGYCIELHGIACYCMVLHGITWYLEFAAYDSSPSYIEQQHASLFFISFVYIIQFLCFCCPNVLFQCSLCVLYVICK